MMYTIIRLVCFLIMGIILGMDRSDKILVILGYGLMTAVYAWILLLFLKKILCVVNKEINTTKIESIYDKSWLFIIPFTVFAMMGKFYYGWNTVQAFISTGIMSAGGVMSMEIAKCVKKKKLNILLITGFSSLMFLGLIQLSIRL